MCVSAIPGIVFLLIAARVHLAREDLDVPHSRASDDTELPAWARDTKSIRVLQPQLSSSRVTESSSSSRRGNGKDDGAWKKTSLELIEAPMEEYEMAEPDGGQGAHVKVETVRK